MPRKNRNRLFATRYRVRESRVADDGWNGHWNGYGKIRNESGDSMNAKRGYGGNESGEMKDEESEMFYDKTLYDYNWYLFFKWNKNGLNSKDIYYLAISIGESKKNTSRGGRRVRKSIFKRDYIAYRSGAAWNNKASNSCNKVNGDNSPIACCVWIGFTAQSRKSKSRDVPDR